MIKHNIKPFESISDFILKYGIIPILSCLFIWMNPWIVFGTTVISATLIYFIFFPKKNFWEYYKWILLCCFLVLTFIYSLSPRLEYLMYKVEHRNWTEVKGNIEDFEVEWHPSRRRQTAKGSASVTFTGILGNASYTFTEHRALYNYSFRMMDTEESIKDNIHTLTAEITQYIETDDYAIFIKNDASEGRIFLLKKWLLLSNSLGMNIVTGWVTWLGLLGVLVYSYYKIGKRLKKK